MLSPDTTATVAIAWGDRDGDTAVTTLRFPFSISREQAFSSGVAVANAMQALSNAMVQSITVRYRYHEDTPNAPGLLSDVGYYLCLYYSNDVDTEPIFLPSPNQALLETSGDFAGIRLNLSDPAVAALADALTSALATTVSPDRVAFGRYLVVGGRTR